MPAPKRDRRARLLAWVLVALFAAAGPGGVVVVDRLFPPPLANGFETSRMVLDREGEILRPYAIADGRWRLSVALDRVDPDFVRRLLAYEDRRFATHIGVDPLAALRAAFQLWTSGRIVSGASTLSMQLARLSEPEMGRGPAGKLKQIVRALQLEHRYSKRDILQAYLALAPYGGNLEGIRSASMAYFGREPRKLTLTEQALLVALPQAPELRRPDRRPAAALGARNRVLARLAAAGLVEPVDAERAASLPLRAFRREFPALAAHSADRAIRQAGPGEEVRLTLRRPLQAALEELAAARANTFGRDMSLAILVADHASGEVLARVGSASFFDEKRRGQIDMSRAIRSPGSTLKPLIYGLGFETGIIHPATLIEDRPTDFSGYRPANFDAEYRGTVTIAEALQASLNVPAVQVLESVGPARLMSRLRRAGIDPRMPQDERAGLAIALGGLGVTLEDLVRLYGAIGRGGDALALTEQHGGGAENTASPVLNRSASWYLADILARVPPPDHAAAGRIAYKTGTSYGYRDAWSIGFDGRHVIGVWVGRADGASVPGLTGRSHAAPVLFEAFARLSAPSAPLPARPADAFAAATADLPTPLRRFVPPGGVASAAARREPVPAISFPPEGARLADAGEGILLKVRGGTPPFRWLANDSLLHVPAHQRTVAWRPGGKGFAGLTVIDATGRSDRVTVYLD